MNPLVTILRFVHQSQQHRLDIARLHATPLRIWTRESLGQVRPPSSHVERNVIINTGAVVFKGEAKELKLDDAIVSQHLGVF